MKILHLTGLRTGFLALALVLTAGTISAQPNTTNRPTTAMDRDIDTVRTTHVERDNDTDWGWLGLLGLLGLCGLLPKKRAVDNDRVDINNRNNPNR